MILQLMQLMRWLVQLGSLLVSGPARVKGALRGTYHPQLLWPQGSSEVTQDLTKVDVAGSRVYNADRAVTGREVGKTAGGSLGGSKRVMVHTC